MGARLTTAPVFVADREVLLAGGRIVLDGAEGRHAARVRRMRTGERVDLVDGAGLRVNGVIESVGPDTVVVAVRSRIEEPLPTPRLVVVQALAKGDRDERAVEMLTEVGVDEIVPWAASRSVTQWRGERGAKALARWRSTAREAAKQARRAWFPEVTNLVSTGDLAARASAGARVLVLHEEAETSLAEYVLPNQAEIVLVVGPEGGVAPEELAALADVGAVPVRLGPTVLRTSTAGVVAAALVLARCSARGWITRP